MTDAASRPRLLVVAPRYDYIAPTSTIFFSGLEKRFDVVYWGPGYVPMDALGRDLRAVEDELGPFHAVLVHQFFILGTLAAARRSIAAAFPVGRFLERFPGFPVGLTGLGAHRVGVALMLDPYALTQADADRLESFGGPLVSWPVEGVAVSPEYFAVKDAIVPPSTAFVDFFGSHPERHIPFHHFMADDEFDAVDWDTRQNDVFVPGAAYGRRKQAKRLLARMQVRLLDRASTMSTIKLLFGGRPYRFRSGLRLLQGTYRRGIRSSKICFVEGSGFNFPVRKYLEVPAFGSLLVAVPCNGARGIGFVDRESYISTSPDDLGDAVMEMLRNPEEAQRIVRNGQALVRRSHTQSARAEQFASCLNAILAGRYHGAEWREGEFVLREQAPAHLIQAR